MVEVVKLFELVGNEELIEWLKEMGEDLEDEVELVEFDGLVDVKEDDVVDLIDWDEELDGEEIVKVKGMGIVSVVFGLWMLMMMVMEMGKKVSKSEMIREELKKGLSVGEVSRKLGIRYQYVYGVSRGVEFEVKKGERKVVLVKIDGVEMSRSDGIRLLWGKGVERGEISRRLKCQYQVVWGVVEDEVRKGKKCGWNLKG